MSMGQFNGVSLFASTANPKSDGSEAAAVFGISGKQDRALDHTMSIYTSENGSTGSKVSVHKSLLLSALTMNSRTHGAVKPGKAGIMSPKTEKEDNDFEFSLASEKLEQTISLNSVSVNVFLTALENIAALRAQNGASMSRLNFQAINLSRQRTNMEAANGRIIDVDMGAESTRLAKFNVLTQSAAAMLAQANTTPDVALILLRR